VAWAKQQGLAVYGEAVTYHLVLNTTHYGSLGTLAKVSPPLRRPEQQDRLWEAIDEGGLIDTICSEHTPHTRQEKEGPMRHAASGMPGIQESLPLLITAFAQRFPHQTVEERLVRLARLTATNVARIFGLKGKGEIRVGNDADLVVVDPTTTWKIHRQDLLSKCGWSAYEGWEVRGRPIATFLRGRPVCHDGQGKGEPRGRMIASRV
jgi:dihydroorotase